VAVRARSVLFEGADERACADGQAVWSWHPGADAKLAMTYREWRGQWSRSPGRARRTP